jgi:hypothetical protein
MQNAKKKTATASRNTKNIKTTRIKNKKLYASTAPATVSAQQNEQPKQTPKYGDIGTPELALRKGVRINLVEGKHHAYVTSISPIHNLHERNLITTAQFCAGKYLHQQWTRAWGYSIDYTPRERVDGGHASHEMSSAQVNAMREYNRGMDSCGDKTIVDLIILQENSIYSLHNNNGYRNKKLMERLRTALDRLAVTYGYTTPPQRHTILTTIAASVIKI